VMESLFRARRPILVAAIVIVIFSILFAMSAATLILWLPRVVA
jgi:hypothetical protein